MNKSIPFYAFIFSLLLTSCAHVPCDESTPRSPASEKNCQQMVKGFFDQNAYEDKLTKALADKKLFTKTNKFIIVEHPRLEWINAIRGKLQTRVQNWSINKYPAFYIHDEKESLKTIQTHVRTVSSTSTKLSAEQKLAQTYMRAIKRSYQVYAKDLEELMNERISYQYNLNLLKKIKIKKNEVTSFKLTFLKKGKKIETVYNLKQNDKSLAFIIKDIEQNIREFDGTLFKNGKLKDRVIKQAATADILNIYLEELNMTVINNKGVSLKSLRNEIGLLENILNSQALKPSTYGVYRITNQTFIKEINSITKADILAKKYIGPPFLKVKEIFEKYIKDPLAKKTAEEKIGMFQKVYAKVTTITPKQILIGTTLTAGVGIGATAYFAVGEPEVVEIQIKEGTPPPPEVDLEETTGIIEEETQMQNDVINAEIERFLN